MGELEDFDLETYRAGQPTGWNSSVTGRRIGAGFIDLVPLAFVAVAANRARNASMEYSASAKYSVTLSNRPLVVMLVVFVGYYLVCELLTGTSPGKRVVGLAVVDSVGGPVDMRQVVIRSLFRLVDGFPFIYLVGFVAMLSSPGKQRVGDRVAQTRVVSISTAEAKDPALRTRSVRSSVVLVAVVTLTVGGAVARIITH